MPILAVVVIGALAAGVTVWVGRRPKSERPAAADGPTGGVSAERARHASSLLSEDQHRAVYGRIATNRPMEAITEYRRVTGRTLRESMVDVQSLAAYPQVYTLPQEPDLAEARAGSDAEGAPDAARQDGPMQDTAAPVRHDAAADEIGQGLDESRPGGDQAAGAAGEEAAAGAQGGADLYADRPDEDGAAPAAVHGAEQAEGEGPSSGRREASPAEPAREEEADAPSELMVPAEWSAEPAPEDRPFEVEVMRGDGTVHLSSRDLPPWLRDQLSAMVRDGNLETAAVQLSTHTELSVPEAFELLRRIQESRGQ